MSNERVIESMSGLAEEVMSTAFNRYCPKCEDYPIGGPTFCTKCGGRTVPYPVCETCKRENTPSSKFCRECGNHLATADALATRG